MSEIQANPIIKHHFCCILVSICIVFLVLFIPAKVGRRHKEPNKILFDFLFIFVQEETQIVK